MTTWKRGFIPASHPTQSAWVQSRLYTEAVSEDEPSLTSNIDLTLNKPDCWSNCFRHFSTLSNNGWHISSNVSLKIEILRELLSHENVKHHLVSVIWPSHWVILDVLLTSNPQKTVLEKYSFRAHVIEKYIVYSMSNETLDKLAR